MKSFLLLLIKLSFTLILWFPKLSLAARSCSELFGSSEMTHLEYISEFNSEWRQAVGRRVKNLIDGDTTISIKDLAELLEMKPHVLYSIRRGDLAPTVKEAENLAYYFGVEANWIFIGPKLKSNGNLIGSLNAKEQWWFSSLYRAYTYIEGLPLSENTNK